MMTHIECAYDQRWLRKNNAIKKIKTMAKLITNLMLAFLVFLAGEMVGFRNGYLRREEMAQIEHLSQEDLHQEMLEKNTIVLNKFFPQLEKVRHARVGDTIFSDRMGDIYLARIDIIYGHKSYTLEDNHANIWYLFKDGELFFLSKRREE
jgi:hypothetical protein